MPLVNKLLDAMLKEKFHNSELNMTEMKSNFSSNKEGVGFNREFEWYTKHKISCTKCNDLWKTIITEYPEFKFDIIKECLSGEYKFGSNIGKANYLVKLESSSSTKIVSVIDLSQSSKIVSIIDQSQSISKLGEYCSKIGVGNPFACKSSGSSLWMRFL